jgi:hypothetical protein
LQHDLAPVRTSAMLDQIDALPGAERELSPKHRDVQRDAREHRLHVRGHIVRPLGLMHPRCARGREVIESRQKIGANIGIRILLNDQRSGGVPQVQEECAVGGIELCQKSRGLRRNLGQSAPSRLYRQRRGRNRRRSRTRANG